ncbi:integrator complex subunit 10 isoform X1 [Drosophila sechellia]|uniref:Integrator complex subunit 10 n=1 Tax=Drosophila sechellia TaxID=7238 RepID=B4HTU2_DROSE|nr:integrator complex subunit 10 isoform X1 [Drosophila sechellia]XP_032574917.1 integrator complex subunit 10 isoform X1 [Drosophila sechellia]EDW50363.1 GM14586 [Drosophila sechellia]
MPSHEENEMYMVKEAQRLRKSDPCAAMAWIITAKTLYPNAFNLQYEAYLLERDGQNYEEAAKCFSAIATNFQNQHTELWQEINSLTNALRNENETTPEHEFYVKMYKHLTPEVQHNIFMHTINHSADNLERIYIYILMFNKFPKSAITQAPRLLEMLAEGMKTEPDLYQRILVEEVLPMIQNKPPELSPNLACRLYTSSLEFYLRQIMDESDTADAWKNIFKVLMICGQMMGWEPFLPFSKHVNQNVYWEKLVDILSGSPAGSSQVLFYATTLFIYSLHGYIRNCKLKIEDAEVSHVLVEGFMEWSPEGDGSDVPSMEPPKFSLTTAISPELSKAFLHAAQCWQLLNTDQFQRDFSQLMLALPLAPWISRFLFDLAIYFGHRDEANKLLADMTTQSSLVQSLQILSLNLMQGSMTLQGFQCILKILSELPTTQGQLLENMSLKGHRHMVFLPLTRSALVQYCVGAIISRLSRKVLEPNCPDRLLGDILVLQQLNLLNDVLLTQQIFNLIKQRKSFNLRTLSTYIINIDLLEELSHIWNSQQEDNFELTSSPISSGTPTATTVAGGSQSRRIGTRGADKGARDEFRAITRQQIARCNENVITLLANFINQEHLMLAQHIFGISQPVETIVIK